MREVERGNMEGGRGRKIGRKSREREGEGHLRKNHMFKILLHQFKPQATKSHLSQKMDHSWRQTALTEQHQRSRVDQAQCTILSYLLPTAAGRSQRTASGNRPYYLVYCPHVHTADGRSQWTASGNGSYYLSLLSACSQCCWQTAMDRVRK